MQSQRLKEDQGVPKYQQRISILNNAVIHLSYRRFEAGEV